MSGFPSRLKVRFLRLFSQILSDFFSRALFLRSNDSKKKLFFSIWFEKKNHCMNRGYSLLTCLVIVISLLQHRVRFGFFAFGNCRSGHKFCRGYARSKWSSIFPNTFHIWKNHPNVWHDVSLRRPIFVNTLYRNDPRESRYQFLSGNPLIRSPWIPQLVSRVPGTRKKKIHHL